MERIASRIETVTVFQRGAEVTRACRVPAGAEVVEIAGLPLCLEDGSVTARYDGAGEARELRVVLALPDAEPDAPPADDEELAAVEAELARLEAEAALLDAELRAIDGLAPRARQRPEREPPPPAPVAARREVIALRDALTERAHARQRALAEARREVARRRDLLADRRARDSSATAPARHELRKAIVVRLSEAAAADHTLRIGYFVPGARWAPAYAVRLDEALTTAALELRAIVAQRSGEDWRGATLVLSTADRHRLHDLPKLPARRIGRRQPPPARGWRAPPADTAALYDDYRRFRATQPAPRPPVQAPPPPSAAPAAAAPPPPLGAPMPEGAPQAVARAMVSAAAPPRALAAKTRGRVSFAASLSESAAADLPVAPEPPLAPRYDEVDEALLDYGRLRMPPPGEATAGKLEARPSEALYLETLHLETTVQITVDVQVQIAAARQEADALPEPPERHTLAWSESYDHAFATETPVDVPSDGTFHGIAVQRAEAALSLVHVVVPRESTAAFRTARLDNPLAAPLLPGPVDVYHGRDYLTASRVAFTPVGGELRLGLGVEQGVKVARNARFREESAGLIGNALVLAHDVAIELSNRSGRAVDLEVRERLPVVRRDEDEVKVTPRDVSPPWEPFEPFPSSADRAALRGGHRWRLRLEEGGAQTLRFGYDVRIAAKHELAGGNRREP